MAIDIIDDLVAEQDRLEGILAGLPAQAWHEASGADGWTVRDVVLHLAQTEEAVAATISSPSVSTFDRGGGTLDEAMDRLV